MYISLFYTLLSGLFFLIGIVILDNIKNKERFSLFTISIAFIVMIGLILFDILPEVYSNKNIYMIFFIILGFILLLFLDKLIPHHHHQDKEKCNDLNEHNLHLNHVSTLTIIALIFHNMVEGAALYSVSINNYTSGLLMLISIGCHNIPLGFQIGNTLNKDKTNILLKFLLLISAMIGALILIIFGNINSIFESIILSITMGMLLYILIFELFRELQYNFKKKEVIYGIIIGILILIVTVLI
jgi:zinc transporter, ZIP family